MFNKQIEENKIPEITWLFLKKMRREKANKQKPPQTRAESRTSSKMTTQMSP